jgi:dTDP-4-amino-4,6-dideoxygalactose transaminase
MKTQSLNSLRQKLIDSELFFDEPIQLCRPYIPDRDEFLKAVNEILDRQWLTNEGPCVVELEKRIAELHDVAYCSIVCNATLGLQLVIKALNLTGEIIVPSFTFIASAHACFFQAVQPIFCDVEERYGTLDPKKAEKLITPRTSGIMGVHLFGNPCRVEELSTLCKTYGLALIFDAAHSFLARYRGTSIGNFGDAEVLSFHATKFFSTMEGGAILTNNRELFQKIKLLKNFGFSGLDRVEYLGTNAKMTEVCAAFGLAGLSNFKERVECNRQIQQRYRDNLSGLPGVKFLDFNPELEGNYQYVVMFVDHKEFGLNRDSLYELLREHNVMARRYFYPGCHRMEPYNSMQPRKVRLLPVTEKMVKKVLCLPCYFGLTLNDVDKICLIIRTMHEMTR